MSLVCRWKYFFFQSLFPWFFLCCFPVCPSFNSIDIVVACRYNQCFFAFVCIYIVLNTSESSTFFSDIYSIMSRLMSKTLCIIIISFSFLFSIIPTFLLVHFKMDPEYLTRDADQISIPLIRFYFQEFLLFFWGIPTSLFLSSLFTWWIFATHVFVLFSLPVSGSFLIGPFYLFRCFLFFFFHYKNGIFSNSKTAVIIIVVAVSSGGGGDITF